MILAFVDSFQYILVLDSYLSLAAVPCHNSRHVEAVDEGDEAVPRDGSVGRLQRRDAAPRPGDAHGAARVRAEGDERRPRGDGRGRSARAAPGHDEVALAVGGGGGRGHLRPIPLLERVTHYAGSPGALGGTGMRVHATGTHAELVGVGLADYEGAGRYGPE